METTGNRIDNELEVLDTMETFGGGFASALAVAWRRADGDNAARLRAAFPELWAKYAELAKARRDRNTLVTNPDA